MENKSITSEIEKLSLKDLKALLKEVKQYQDMDKKL